MKLSLKTVALAALLCLFAQKMQATDEASLHWWKGNLHTHSLWSDGDDYPEMITDWYKSHGYNFLMISDHNVFMEGERWSGVKTNKGGLLALDNYKKRFGDKWVKTRTEDGQLMVRLSPLKEFRSLFEDPEHFLLIKGEEITGRYKTAGIHINATNLRELIKPKTGDSVLAVVQSGVDAVNAQRQRTGQPMFPHINHPNFTWAITAEELMQVKGDKFFEVYNGHPMVHNEGDTTHAGIERVWDIVLTKRLAELKLGVLYGLATDDAHNYHTNAVGHSNTGRGWVMVRTPKLKVEGLIQAMEAGDFYSSSGVVLKDVRREKDKLSLEIEPKKGVEYTVQFIGTRKGYDPKDEPVRTASGEMLRVTHRYSDDIGKVLAEVKGTSASYQLKGDEIYVRAKVISTKIKANPYVTGEYECAWTQPLVPGAN